MGDRAGLTSSLSNFQLTVTAEEAADGTVAPRVTCCEARSPCKPRAIRTRILVAGY
jgi:hypothetical protein